jgi:hypothetical protein
MPALHGMVSNISADALNDERSGSACFRLEVTIPPQEVERIESHRGSECGLRRPAGQCDGPVRRRTAVEYLVQPVRQTLWRSFHER